MAGDIQGPDPILENDELVKKIKQCILDGKNLKDTANICGLNEDSFYVWHSDNYLDIATKIEGWKRDRKVMLAADNVEEILTMSIVNKGVTKDGKEIYEFDDTGKLRVKADISKFVLEALDKPYKPKSDLTTGDKPISILNNVISGNDSNKKNIETKQEA